ncbi:MAG TPA: protein-methionine-sulfoxide reductase catalytic subunit MsrP [Bryobacteraceae bacterium]|jgi:sulfoxide reductase catalytic subunit YedY
MLIRKHSDLRYSDVTPKELYLNRRRFLGAGAAALGAGALAGPFSSAASAATKLAAAKTQAPFSTTEKQTPLATITTYNNFYEFGTGKEDPSQLAPRWKVPAEWPIRIEGAGADKPYTVELSQITAGKVAPLEERIYRHRCVERWSIVVPWIGIPLSAVLKTAAPNSKAKFVAFQSYYDSKAMLSQGEAGIRFPYVEGLRLDEAMNPLTLLVVGLYGETLPNQNGAPMRLAVPWKYGFKSIKSINKISLVENMPPTTWNIANAREYGFYSNVNPEVDHPRWSQATENRLGELTPRKTVKFNGYEAQVGGMYAFLDLRKNY